MPCPAPDQHLLIDINAIIIHLGNGTFVSVEILEFDIDGFVENKLRQANLCLFAKRLSFLRVIDAIELDLFGFISLA